MKCTNCGTETDVSDSVSLSNKICTTCGEFGTLKR